MDIRSWLEEHPRAGFMLYSTLATSVVAVIFLTNWPTYSLLVRGGGYPLLYYYIAVVALTAPLICAEPAFVMRLAKEYVFWWMAVFLLAGLLWLLLSQDFIDTGIITWNSRLAAFGLFCAITLLAAEADKRVIALLMISLVALASATTWFDVLRPYRIVPHGIENASFGRGAGFFINPNIAASFITMATLAALPSLPRRLRAIVLLVAALGIVPTFSRAGFIYIALLLAGPLVLGMLGRLQSAILLGLAGLAIAIITVSYDFLLGASDNVYVHQVIQRLLLLQGAEVDEAAFARMNSAEITWQMFLDHPVLGRGTGVTRVEEIVPEGGPHNMYLMFMGEHGIIGAMLYPGLIVILVLRAWQLLRAAEDTPARDVGKTLLLYATFLTLHGFFSHNVFEEPQGMFALAFLMATALRAQLDLGSQVDPAYAAYARGAPVPRLTPNLRRH